jgi:hypothetical protein
VPRQHLGKEDRDGASAAAAPPAVGAKGALAARSLCGGGGGIVTREAAVTVQRAPLAAVWAALLLERKSSAFNAGSSGTKRTHAGRMRRWCPDLWFSLVFPE